VNELISHYPVKRAASLMVLHAIQEKFGWISQEAAMWTAKKLELAPINIFEILTFYPMLRQQPMGKYQIKVCRTLSCALGGAYELHNIFATNSAWTRMRTDRRHRRTESSRLNSSSAWPVAARRR
jgi:NADH:ubiquinone oxidoreductase subunit E